METKNSKPAPRKFKTFLRKKPCVLCQQGVNFVDYKDTELLSKYISYNGKILPRRITGCCAKHQRMIANAVKKAREAAVISYVFD